MYFSLLFGKGGGQICEHRLVEADILERICNNKFSFVVRPESHYTIKGGVPMPMYPVREQTKWLFRGVTHTKAIFRFFR